MAVVECFRFSVRASRLRRWAVGVGMAAIAAACGQTSFTDEEAAPLSRASGDAVTGDVRTVTLITGDRVTLSAGTAVPSVQIEPGPGRANVGFATIRVRDDMVVIPRDVASLVARGVLDRALFDVTRLIAEGHSDADRDDVPLIITGGTPGARASGFAASGLVVDRVIPAIHAVAARQRKSSAGAVLASLDAARGVTVGPPTKIWLDRRLQPVLDHSVPQIGGTVAWARGYTGAGVVVRRQQRRAHGRAARR